MPTLQPTLEGKIQDSYLFKQKMSTFTYTCHQKTNVVPNPFLMQLSIAQFGEAKASTGQNMFGNVTGHKKLIKMVGFCRC
jgi:hypothetical protein